jgi:hypothetical protein
VVREPGGCSGTRRPQLRINIPERKIRTPTPRTAATDSPVVLYEPRVKIPNIIRSAENAARIA